jgi:hypothetical protein
MSAKITDTDKGFNLLLKRMLKDSAPVILSVGIHEAEGQKPYEPKGDKKKRGDDEASGDRQSDGEPITLAQLGEIHEFGIGVPARSFLADWVDETREDKLTQLRNVAKAFVKGELPSIEAGYEKLGNLYVGQIQKRIAEGIEPALSDYTVKQKGSSVPLIDTGQLRSAITYVVRERP